MTLSTVKGKILLKYTEYLICINSNNRHKYALASVKKILGWKNSDIPLDIMYDIACKVKKNLTVSMRCEN